MARPYYHASVVSYLELLRSQPRFRRLWFGQIVSQCGDWLQLLALLEHFPTSGSGVQLLATLFVVRTLPVMLWMPAAGVVADRFPRGQVMVVCDLARAAVVFGYLFAPDAFWILVLVFAQESITAFFEPARTAAIPQVVPERALLAANSLAGATWSAMLALGSALGGLLTATLGSRTALLLNAASFVLSAAFIASVGIPPVASDAPTSVRPPPDAPPPRDRLGFASLAEGARWLRAHSPQAAVALVKASWGLAGGLIFLVPVWADRVFGPSSGIAAASATGWLYAGRGIGALIGPLVARRAIGESIFDLRRGIQLAFPIAALAYASFAHAGHLAIAALILVVAHAGGSTLWVASTQILQLTVPNRLQGRVFAVELAAFMAAFAASTWLAAAAVARGASLRIVTLALAAVALGSGLAFFLTMRRLGDRLG